MGVETEKNQLGHQSHPWLVICDTSDENWKIFFSISRNKYYTEIIPHMHNQKIHTCSHGWLVLEDYSTKDCCLFNPKSMEKIQLPTLEFDCDMCVLSSAPTDPNCHVCFFKDLQTIILFCRPGDNKFIQQECGDDSITGVTMHQGKLFYLAENDTLGTLNFKESKLEITPLIMDYLLHPCYSSFFAKYLIECEDKVLLVYQMVFGSEVRDYKVFQFNFMRNRWEESENIGGWTIFLSYKRGMSYRTTDLRVKPNSIYFVRENDRCLRNFDLEDRSFSMTLPCPALKCYHSEFDWIMM